MTGVKKRISKLIVAVVLTVMAFTQAFGLTAFANENDSYVYASMNIPYGAFYQSEGTDIYYDTVTTATTQKFKMTDVLAKGTYNDGEIIRGVVYPVKMTASTYAELTADQNADSGSDYYIYTDTMSEEESAAYKELTYTDGEYSFSKAESNVDTSEAASTISVGELVTTEQYGDYQFDLVGVKTATMEDDGETEITPVTIGDISNVDVAAVVLTADNGKTYGMGMLENTWTGNRRPNVEIAVSVEEGQHLTNHGGAEFKTFEGLNGATITKVTILSNQGIFEVDSNLFLTPYYDGDEEMSVNGNDGDSVIDVTIPSAFENPTVSVSYTIGAGRGARTYYVAENVTPVDGKVQLNSAIDFESNGSYTVIVNSDNYALKKLTIKAVMTASQRAKLEEYVATGKALVANDASLTTLAEHIEEAEVLLAQEDAESGQASELIGELETLISEVKIDISKMTATLSKTSYTYNGKVQTPAVSIKSAGALKKGTDYTVTYSTGRKNVGKYTVTIKGTGNYKGTITKTYTINPKGTSVSKVKAAKKAFTATWKKQSTQTTGYQIQYSTSKKFTKAKTVTVKSLKTTSKKVTKLAKKKKYYVRVRTYKTVSGKNYYSAWSSAKTVKTK